MAGIETLPELPSISDALDVELKVSLHQMVPFDADEARIYLANPNFVVVNFRRDPSADRWVNTTPAEWTLQQNQHCSSVGLWHGDEFLTAVPINGVITSSSTAIVKFDVKKLAVDGLTTRLDPKAIAKARAEKEAEAKALEAQFEKLRKELARGGL
jgi:hypothetical protein